MERDLMAGEHGDRVDGVGLQLLANRAGQRIDVHDGNGKVRRMAILRETLVREDEILSRQGGKGK